MKLKISLFREKDRFTKDKIYESIGKWKDFFGEIHPTIVDDKGFKCNIVVGRYCHHVGGVWEVLEDDLE